MHGSVFVTTVLLFIMFLEDAKVDNIDFFQKQNQYVKEIFSESVVWRPKQGIPLQYAVT